MYFSIYLAVGPIGTSMCFKNTSENSVMMLLVKVLIYSLQACRLVLTPLGIVSSFFFF